MKPNLKFLQKVADGNVGSYHGYSAKRGGYWTFRGGEATAKRHAEAGFIRMPGAAGLFQLAPAKLTDAGRAALIAKATQP
jgi:hypothetical protein